MTRCMKHMHDGPGECGSCALEGRDRRIPIGPPKIEKATVGGIKHDTEKVRVELLPWEAVEEVAKVLTFGAKKYSDENWREGFSWKRLVGSTLRHIWAWARGIDKDPETGLSHLAHAGSNILFLIAHELNGYGTDDRVKVA